MTSSNGNISALLTLCAGNSPVTGEFPAQMPVTRGFDIFFAVLWRHCNGLRIMCMNDGNFPQWIRCLYPPQSIPYGHGISSHGTELFIWNVPVGAQWKNIDCTWVSRVINEHGGICMINGLQWFIMAITLPPSAVQRTHDVIISSALC